MGGIFSKSASSPTSGRYAAPQTHHHHHGTRNIQRMRSNKYSHINDEFTTIEQVQTALQRAGLESSNLIVGVDFTKSNEWTGKQTFGGRSLHALGEVQNPYEQAISIIGRTLAMFDEDNLIPCFGFGDASTHDKHVFSFNPDNVPCEGFEGALERYREIVPHVRLAGPTSFAPVIEAAMDIVEESGGQYHVLLIIADGQVTRSVDTHDGCLSPQEKATVDAIVRASHFPLSIVLVGVGDGPWDVMREFDDNIPDRLFDNFQFVNFSEVMSKGSKREASFALAALMEIPSQYKAASELHILGEQHGKPPGRPALPPPQAGGSLRYPSFNKRAAAPAPAPAPSAPRAPSAGTSDEQMCQICLSERKDMAFGCGHQTCQECAKSMSDCPFCRKKIMDRIRLF